MIEIDTRGLCDGPEIEFLDPHRIPGVDQVRYRIRPEKEPIWYLVLQAISLEIGLTKIETVQEDATCTTCISYGGNAVFGNIADIDTFRQLDVGTCVFLDRIQDRIVAVGTISIAKINGDLTIEYYYHDFGYVRNICIDETGNLVIKDDNTWLGGDHVYDLVSGRRIKEL